MAGGWASTRVERTPLAGALVLGYAASAAFSALIGNPLGEAATLATAGGFLAAIFVLFSGAWRVGAAALCLGLHLALGMKEGLARAAVAPLVDLIEAVVAASLAVRFCSARTRLLSLRKLMLILLGAVAPAAAIGGVAGALLTQRADFLPVWLDWAAAGGLGLAIVLPGALLMARASQYRDFQRTRLETIALLASLGLVTFLVFSQSKFPLFFAVFPALTLVAFRLGPPGAAVAGLIVAVIALPLTVTGHGPAMLAVGVSVIARIRLTEVFVAAVLFTGIATAGALADHARLRRLMLGRDRAARAALQRARAAEQFADALEESLPAVRPRIADPV
jgi:integral membrane sensor domain MASE1